MLLFAVLLRGKLIFAKTWQLMMKPIF